MNDIPTPADSSSIVDDEREYGATRLSTEAIAAAVNAYLEGPWIGIGHQAAEAMLEAALPHLPFVDLRPASDVVRVPRVALIELNAAVMDRKRDLVDAIEEFNDEVRP